MVILTTLSNEIELMIPVNNLAILINRFPISGINFDYASLVNVAINDADADFDNGSNYKFVIMHNNYRCFQDYFLQTE